MRIIAKNLVENQESRTPPQLKVVSSQVCAADISRGRNQLKDELLDELGGLSPLGYDVSLHIRAAIPFATFQTYNAAWNQHYSQNTFRLRDPQMAWGISQTGAVRWSEIEIPDPFTIAQEARKFGLTYGIVISSGEISSRTIVRAARGDREYNDPEIAELSEVVLRLHNAWEPRANLTKAELEALTIIAAGERNAKAANTLGISESALKARLTTARKKLLARTTAQAVSSAAKIGLL